MLFPYLEMGGSNGFLFVLGWDQDRILSTVNQSLSDGSSNSF